MYDFLIVGAGYAGCVLAERIASQLNKKVLVVEKRPHIGGLAYDYLDAHGVLIHKYGPHVLHTNNTKPVDYLGRFTDWRPYEHRVLAIVDGKKVPFPVNRETLNQVYDLDLSTSEEVEAFYDSVRVPISIPRNAEDVILAKVGRDLYERFFRGYTKKQWGMDPAELRPSVTERIPIRTGCDDRCFSDMYQVLPKHGYSRMFERMLSHPNIELLLNTDYHRVASEIRYRLLVYTGRIDRFFDQKFGALRYRSLRFVHQYFPCEYVLPVGQLNYPNQYDFTRVTESKHLTGQIHFGTTLTYEYPRWPEDDSYEDFYPVPTEANERLYRKYAEEARKLKSVIFCGRLAEYRYYNMDQVVARALGVFENRIAVAASRDLRHVH